MKFSTLLDKLHLRRKQEEKEEDIEAKRIKELDRQLKKRYRKMAAAPGMIGTCFMCDGYMTEEDKARIKKKIAELK